MPRTIASDIGSRTLTIDDAVDNFVVGDAALPDGSLGVRLNPTPNTYVYMHDRASNGDAYKLAVGQAKTINLWYNGQAQNAPFLFGVGQQNSSGTTAATINWSVSTGGNSMTFNLRNNNGSFSSTGIGLGNTAGWRMLTFAFDPAAGTHGNVVCYVNGAPVATQVIPNAITNQGVCEFSVGARGNYALSSVSPTAAVVAVPNVQIAKLAVFPSYLTALQISDLYLAMVA